MAATDYIALAQQLYVSYFGRPADYYGLQSFTAQLDALGAPTTGAELDALVQSQPTSPLAALVNSFSSSPESIALYGSGTSVLEISKFVNAIYNNVLHRDADAGGTFWINAILSGNLSKANAALAITEGALKNTSEQGLKDAATIKNTFAVATEFTDSLDSIPKINAYAGDAAAALARGLLLGVSDTTVVADYQVKIDDTITTLTAPPSVVSVLTDAADTFVGTAANDVINATDKTYTSLDNINGGTGVNTLNVVDVAGGIDLSIATVSNIQKLNVTSSAGVVADVSGWTSLTAASFNVKVAAGQTFTAADTTAVTVTNTGGATIVGGSSINVTAGAVANATNDVIATNNKALASAVVKGGNDITIADGSTAGTVLKSVSLNGNLGDATLTGKGITTVSLANLAKDTTIVNSAAHAQSITLNNVTGGVITDDGATSLTVTTVATKSAGVSIAAAEATTVTLSAGVDLAVADFNANKATTITVTGAGKTTVDAVSGGALVTLIDSTASTGGLTFTPTLGNGVTFTGGAGKDAVSIGATTKAITTGAGDDTVTVSGAVGAGGSVNAGEGVDTLAGTIAAVVAAWGGGTAATKFTNFETLKVTDALTNGAAFDVSSFAGVTNFVAGDGVVTGGTATASGLGANANVTLGGDLANKAGTLVLATKTDTTADVVNVTLNHAYTDNNDTTATSGSITARLTTTNIETVNVVSSAVNLQTADPVVGYKADIVTNILALSDAQLVTLNVTGDRALNFATSADQTKLATIDASANTAGVAIDATLSASGSAALTIKGSATAGNTLVGGATADTIIGGAKLDVIRAGANGDTLTGGAGNDAFVFLAGDSQIGTGKFDTITDFTANTFGQGANGAAGIGAIADLTKQTGDTLHFTAFGDGSGGVIVDVLTSAADASTYLANHANTANTVVAALDSTNNNLYVDNTGDGVADFYIHLTGVTTITAAAFTVA